MMALQQFSSEFPITEDRISRGQNAESVGNHMNETLRSGIVAQNEFLCREFYSTLSLKCGGRSKSENLQLRIG
jgi:hypothetical protein